MYSVPSWGPIGEDAEIVSYAEWYWWNLEQGPGNPTYGIFSFRSQHNPEFHVQTYGPNFQYPDFASEFHAELWDPDYWSWLFVQSGAKYVVPTAKFHVQFIIRPCRSCRTNDFTTLLYQVKDNVSSILESMITVTFVEPKLCFGSTKVTVIIDSSPLHNVLSRLPFLGWLCNVAISSSLELECIQYILDVCSQV